MPEFKLRVERAWTPQFVDDDGRKLLHQQRARILHELAEGLSLDVKDWGETDRVYPSEFVELVLAPPPPEVLAAMLESLGTSLAKQEIKTVEVETPDGARLDLAGASTEQLQGLAQSWAAYAAST